MDRPLAEPAVSGETAASLTAVGLPYRLRLWLAFRSAVAAMLPPATALTLAFVAWEVWVRAKSIPVYLVPPPSRVFDTLWDRPEYFLTAARVTITEAIAGFALGSAVAILGAVVMSHSRVLERSLFPLAILVKVTPIVAVAPLFTIWFGFGTMPKVFIAALITFFPVLVNAITGFRSVSPGAMELLQSLHASRWEIFFKLRVPSSLPFLFAAFKISITLSVIGAVVGEWTGAQAGLGRIIWLSHTDLNMPSLFAAIMVLATLGIGLYLVVAWLERRLLFWHESTMW